MFGQPTAWEADAKAPRFGAEPYIWQRSLAAPTMQQHRHPQDDGEIEDADMPWRNQVLGGVVQQNFPPVSPDKTCDQPLFFFRESRKIRVGQKIRGMLVMARMRYIQPDFVQSRSPSQCLLRQRILKVPCASRLGHQLEGGMLDSRGLFFIHMKTRRHRPHASLANIVFGSQSPEHVV
mgnify:CR=1 FL=1